MEVHYGYTGTDFKNPVITMGVFDGVHLGHRMLLQRVREEAISSGSDAVAVTFDPHPRIVLTGDPGHLSFLTDIEERIELLGETGSFLETAAVKGLPHLLGNTQMPHMDGVEGAAE